MYKPDKIFNHKYLLWKINNWHAITEKAKSAEQTNKTSYYLTIKIKCKRQPVSAEKCQLRLPICF